MPPTACSRIVTVATSPVRWQRERVRQTEAGQVVRARGSGCTHPRGDCCPIQEVLLLIAILDFTTDSADRPAALAQLEAEGRQVRAMQGNIAFRVYASQQDQVGVTVVHEWDNEASFAGYLGSDSFAHLGEVLRPLMTGPPVSRRFHADLLETVA